MSFRPSSASFAFAAINLLAPLACGTRTRSPAHDVVAHPPVASAEPEAIDTIAKTAEPTPAASSSAGPSTSSNAPSRAEGRRCAHPLPGKNFGDTRSHNDLAHVATALGGDHAVRTWKREMQGVAVDDRLGLKLPAFITREQAIAWTEGPPNATLVGARRWPGQPERWVVIVGDSDELASSNVMLAVLQVEADGKVSRIARTRAPLATTADWNMIPDDYGPTGGSASFRVDALDFAPYDLSPSVRAFGVRTEWSEGYAGGGAFYEELTLLGIQGDELVPIASFPIATFKMLAGEWHASGSRQHDTLIADLVVDVVPKQGKMADLRLRSGRAHDGATFVWNEVTRAYDCTDL